MPEISESKYLVSAGAHWHALDRMKRCIMCCEARPLSAFSACAYVTKQGKPSTRYESRCRACNALRRKARYATKADQDRATSQAWKDRNRAHLADYAARKRQDPEHRSIKAKAQRLRKARARSGQGDDAAIRAIYAQAIAIEKIVACCPVFSLPELGHKMHVDHIKPLAKGGLHEIGNLQILPAGINLRKGVKCPK